MTKKRKLTVDVVYNDIFHYWPEADVEELCQRLARTTSFKCFEPVVITVSPFALTRTVNVS